MRRGTPLALALLAVIGCFGKPITRVAAVIPTENPTGKQENASVVTGSAQEQPIVASSGEGVVATPSQAPVQALPAVVAQDSEMAIADIEVGDPALEEAVQFSVDRAGTVTVQSSVTEGLRLFKVRQDQFRQTELIGDIQAGQNGVQTTIPSAGIYLVAGKEKPLSFADIPLGGDGAQTQYRVQSAQECPLTERELKYTFSGYPTTVYKWTRDTEFPVKVKVYLHRGSGNSDLPEDNFQNWVKYNQTISPDKVTLADRVREYVTDKWDSYMAPNIAAETYNNRRSNCGIPGETWIDACHSAGCLKAWLSLIWRTAGHRTENNLGIIAISPAISGSHWSIKELTDASLSLNYQDKAAHWGAVRTLVQREWGMLLPSSVKKTSLKDALAGTQFSLYNEGARSLAWTGVGTGIPTMNYQWYSLFNFGTPYLQLRLKPEARYTIPSSNPLVDFAPGGYIWPGYTQRMFNYIEAVQALDALFGGTDGKMDVAVCYLNDTPASQSAKIRQFEKEYGNDPILNLIWRKITEPEFDHRIAKAALPWMNAVIAKSPSVVPNDPNPNENAVNDGALTLSQQLGLLDGPSILAPGSKYGALAINKAAVGARLPRRVANWKEFPGREHKQAVVGDTELWNWMNSMFIARTDKLREEERTYVLTDVVKKQIMNIVGPRDGQETRKSDWDTELTGGMYLTITTYTLESPSTEWTQDPLGTGQRNRIRIVVNCWLTKNVERWSDILGQYVGSLKDWDTFKRRVQEDFIVRNGIPNLIVE